MAVFQKKDTSKKSNCSFNQHKIRLHSYITLIIHIFKEIQWLEIIQISSLQRQS
jgi:hypothetical protein